MEQENHHTNKGGFLVILKKIRTFFTWFAVVLLSFIITVAILGFVYENRVKAIVLKELDNYLSARVFVDPADIHFTFIRSFPLASLEFRNVKALDATNHTKKDTLFSASLISLQFNILDILNKKYSVKEISVKDAQLKLWINKKGEDNYHFWKKNNSGTASGFSFSLEKILLRNTGISFSNDGKDQFWHFIVKSAELSGKFSSDNYTLSGEGDLFADYFKSGGADYLSKKEIRSDFILDVKKNLFVLRKLKSVINNLPVFVSGQVTDHGNGMALDLSLKGDDLDIQSVLSLLPEKARQKFSDYESSGLFYLEASVKGMLSRTENPLTEASFGINSGDIGQFSSGVRLKNVFLKGRYSSGGDGRKEQLAVSNFSGTLQKGFIKGNFVLLDFAKPVIELNASASMGLEEARNLFKIDTIQQASGNIIARVYYKGEILHKEKYVPADFSRITASGEFTLTDASLRLKNNPALFDSINTSLTLNNKDIRVDHLRGRYLSSDYLLKGHFFNAVPYLLSEKETVTIEAEFYSSNLNLNEILADKEETTLKDTVYKLALPEYVRLKLNTSIRNLSFKKFEAYDISGTVNIRAKKLTAESLSFKSMDGIINISGEIDASGSKDILIACDADIKKLNIRKLFYQAENFGQEVLQDKHLKGTATARIQFTSAWSPQLIADPDRIHAQADLSIEQGELIGFEPMRAMSKFVKVSELEHIRFSTLQNQVEIKNRKIIIPRMEVRSSAMNISGYGTHTFDNEIDYHVRILFSELLSKKAKGAKKENAEFGVEEEEKGKTSLFLVMTGPLEDPDIRYDRRESMQKIKEDLKTEKQNLKSIFKEEFGWFKKDSTLTKKQQPKKKEEKFSVRWDEKEEIEKEEGP